MTTKIFFPCICTTLKNGETRFLLDNNKNILFCSNTTIKSFDLEKIIDNFYSNKKQDKYFNNTDYPNNCKGKDIQSFNISSENFLPEIVINDEMSKKYYSSDVNINIFEKSLTFTQYFGPNQQTKMELYNKLNINDKKKFAITLHYMDLSLNLVNQFDKLQNTGTQNTGTQDVINRILDFRTNVLEVEIKKEEEQKGLATVWIVLIAIASTVFVVVCIFGLTALYQQNNKKKKEALAVAAAVLSTATVSPTATATTHRVGHVQTGHAHINTGHA
jgi:hypothetical protein